MRQRISDLLDTLADYRAACRELEEAAGDEDIVEALSERLRGYEWQLVCAFTALETPTSWSYDRKTLDEIRERIGSRYDRDSHQTRDMRALLHMIDIQDSYLEDLKQRVQGLIDLTAAYQHDAYFLIDRVRRNVRRAWRARAAS